MPRSRMISSSAATMSKEKFCLLVLVLLLLPLPAEVEGMAVLVPFLVPFAGCVFADLGAMFFWVLGIQAFAYLDRE